MRIFLIAAVVQFVLAFSNAYSQTHSLSGYVRDAQTGETLIGAVIKVNNTTVAVPTNSYGFYSITLPEGSLTLTVSFIGYQQIEEPIDVFGSGKKNFEMVKNERQLDEIVITGEQQDKNVRAPQMGQINIGMEETKNIPVIFGEKDILKTIQLLPGVSTGGEGSSNFYVRGGGGDQNLVLLDEATVYNASHLLGFFSTFNSDAIKDVNLYKGGIPAQYGGRISSVLDISMLDGNDKAFAVEGGLGLIASRLKVEGPIKKDKSSFMLSGRRTYADMFLKLSNDESVKKSKLYFYDLNAKLNYKISDRHTLYLSGYFGKDDLGYSDLFGFNWGNSTATVRWNFLINERLFSNTSFIFSDFNYNVDVNSSNTEFTIASQIKNWNLKQDFSFYQNNQQTWRFGGEVLRQTIRPASLNASENTSVNSLIIEPRHGLELSLYASHEWKAHERFSAIFGIRATDFMVLGPGTFYDYDDEGTALRENLYNNEIIKQHVNIEPRVSMSYLLSGRSSLKASYNRISQNLHQLTNTTSSLPTDQYVLSSKNIKPQIADQVALGYFRNFQDNDYEFSVESYYKWMQNQIDFRNGADLQANIYLEGELLNGEGRSYGIEWLLKKNRGRFTGWLSYTLSKSERKFAEINFGDWYNARQDRTHDISLVGIYSLSKKWTLGATFVYNTGNAITFPSGKYQVNGETMFYYTERNGYRMPDYHRLDLSLTYEKPSASTDRWRSSWSFGLYNAYNRKNAYIIDFRENEDNKDVTEAYRIALFGIIPSISWNFKF